MKTKVKVEISDGVLHCKVEAEVEVEDSVTADTKTNIVLSRIAKEVCDAIGCNSSKEQVG